MEAQSTIDQFIDNTILFLKSANFGEEAAETFRGYLEISKVGFIGRLQVEGLIEQIKTNLPQSDG